MKRLFLLIVFLVVSIQSDAAKMSSYTNNTTPNGDVYFVGVDPNDISQTANGSNYRYSLNSILNLGLLDAVFNSLSIAGTGDSWIELENNTSFSDSIAGKYGLRFYNGALQQIINGTATDIGSASVIQRSSDPVYTDLSTGQIAVSTSSGDLFIKTSTGMYTFAGSYAADPTPPTFASASIAVDGVTVTTGFSEAVSQGAGYSDLHFNLDASTTGPDIGLTYVSGSGTNSWVFTAASTILQGETVNLDFSGAGNSVEDGDGTDMDAVINYTVTNGSTQTGNEYADIIYYDNYDDAGGAEVYISAPTYHGLTYGTGAVGNCAIVTGTAGAEIPIANFDLESGVIGFWYSSETVNANEYYFFASDVSADFSGMFAIAQSNASFYYKTTYKQYNTYALPSETWIFVELIITNGTTMDVKINGTSIGTLTGASGTFTATKIGIPTYNNHYTRVMKYDNLIVSNDPARDLYALRNTTGF